MKNLLLTLFILLLNFSNAATLKIQEAIKENLITVNILPNDNSTHYHTPFVLAVENKSKLNQSIVLENGTVLIAEDVQDQDFIVTQEELLVLNAGQSVKFEVHAMCIEQVKSAPNEDSKYTIGALANAELRKLSSFIQANKKFEPDAQFLMWDIAEGQYSEDQIDGFTIDTDGVVWVVDNVDGENKVLDEDTFEEPEAQPKLIVSGSFAMNFSRQKNVHIAMFNARNVLVKELFKNPNCPAGEHGLNYSFNSYDYPEEEYFVKLIVDGEVQLNRRIEMSF